ncbi:MAG: hypothetical protein IKL10_04110 [Clostridia bacterium]|nr:hypothetical protein [Clostridia bacterium]
MKIKGKSGISLKTVGIISAVLFGLLFVIRLYHTFALTDSATGFFTENNFTVILMYILAVGSVIAVCIFSYICSDLPSGDMKKKPSLFYTAAGFLFALTLLYDGIKNILIIVGTKGSFNIIKEAVGGNIGLLSTVFALFGAFTVFAATVIYVKSGTLTGKLKIPMLFPVIWAFLETLGFFSVTVSYVKVSQLLLSIFFTAFLMVFLFENARVTTGVGRQDALWFFYASGIITAGLALSSGVPLFLANLFAPEKLISYTPFELYTLGGGIYALASMLVRAGVKEKTEEENIVTENE